MKEVSKVSVFDGFRGVRFCSGSFDGTVFGNWVPGTRGIKKVPGQGFRRFLCTSKVDCCAVKVYFYTLICFFFLTPFCRDRVSRSCFCTFNIYLLCFASILVYDESMLSCFEGIVSCFVSLLLYVENIIL